MLPAAPDLFSTTTCWPKTSLRLCASMRPERSAGPPGGKPPTNLMAWSGSPPGPARPPISTRQGPRPPPIRGGGRTSSSFPPFAVTLGLCWPQENGGNAHGETHQPRHRTLGSRPGDLLRRPAYRPCADLRAGPPGLQDVGRLHQYRNGARCLRHDGAGRIHARPGRWRADQSGHRTPAIIVEAPVNGIDGPNVAFNAWQFRQILARGCTASCSARPSRPTR